MKGGAVVNFKLQTSNFKIALLCVIFLSLGISANALTLKESVEIALKQNPLVIASRREVEAARARLGQATGSFLPSIKLEGNYGRSYNQPSVVQITMPTTLGAVTQEYTFGTDAATDTRGWTASLSQPLFVAPLFPKHALAQKNLTFAQEDLRKVELETTYNVTQAYFGVLKASKMVKLAEDSLKMAQTHLNQVKVMLSVGTATKGDLLRAEVQVANSETNLTRLKHAYILAQENFKNVLGLETTEEISVEEEKLSGSLEALPQLENILALALSARPEWKQNLLAKEIAEEGVKLVQASYFPSLLLFAQSGNRVVDYPTYRSDVNSWSVVGAASWNLFDGLVRENQLREAVAKLEEQRAKEEQVKKGIALEVKEVYLNLKSALDTISSTKKALEAAEESYNFSNQRFLAGVGTNLEVISAQVSLTQAQVDYLQALFDLELAKAKINRVVGSKVF